MKKLVFLLIAVITFTFNGFSQNTTTSSSTNDVLADTKLVVGIVVDQMRYDYLTRFYHRYGEGGFKRMLHGGFEFKNNHYSYLPTYTGPGHASVYTGTYPAMHGVIANNWYDKKTQQSVYCAGDENVQPVGTQNKAGKMSPHRMKTTSITDELKLHTQQRSKVISISLKDRGAILPAGHSANAAYWFHGKDEGRWITSSFYMDELPQWVKDFNNSGKAQNYLNQTWEPTFPIETYTASGKDNSPFEQLFKGKETPTFPYNLQELSKDNNGFDIIKETIFGNSITTDFALAALKAEQLGKNNATDFLAISYSSPDYIGHVFGPNSVEVEDNYIQLDKELERLFNHLDAEVGKSQYMVFLTADHGVTHIPGYLQTLNIPAGYFDNNKFIDDIKHYSQATFGADVIERVQSSQLFLDKAVLKANKLDARDVQQALADYLITYPKIEKVYTRKQLESGSFMRDLGYLVQNGFHQKRSGDVVYLLEPSTLTTWYERGGTSHGTGYTYDTHAPLIFYGSGIKKGQTYQKSEITDIAPTLSALLGISRPNGATGRVLVELFE